jgi:hypothetical protein
MKNLINRSGVVILLYLFGLTTFHHLAAQSIQPSVIASEGGYFQQGNATLSWTIGETVTQSYFQTFQQLTQGFQQPDRTNLNLKAFIEGYWDGTSGMYPVLATQGQPSGPGACDTVSIELHRSIPPYDLLSSAKGVLQQNGRIRYSGTVVSGEPCYIVIKHRNALETWSAMPVLLGENTFCDFTIASTQAYGGNMAEISPGTFALYTGDINRDENIDLLDFNLLESDINLFLSGYLPTDFNGDGNIDLLDSPLLENNINAFTYSIHP